MKKIFICLLVLGLGIGIGYGVRELLKPEQAVGSVTIGGEYHATTTRSFNGVAMPNLTVLRSVPGVLGSVTITATTSDIGSIVIYDATSTVTNTAWATTTLAIITTNTPGTYTFDAIARKGILVGYTGTMPTSTITYR